MFWHQESSKFGPYGKNWGKGEISLFLLLFIYCFTLFNTHTNTKKVSYGWNNCCQEKNARLHDNRFGYIKLCKRQSNFYTSHMVKPIENMFLSQPIVKVLLINNSENMFQLPLSPALLQAIFMGCFSIKGAKLSIEQLDCLAQQSDYTKSQNRSPSC